MLGDHTQCIKVETLTVDIHGQLEKEKTVDRQAKDHMVFSREYPSWAEAFNCIQ